MANQVVAQQSGMPQANDYARDLGQARAVAMIAELQGTTAADPTGGGISWFNQACALTAMRILRGGVMPNSLVERPAKCSLEIPDRTFCGIVWLSWLSTVATFVVYVHINALIRTV